MHTVVKVIRLAVGSNMSARAQLLRKSSGGKTYEIAARPGNRLPHQRTGRILSRPETQRPAAVKTECLNWDTSRDP